MDDGFQETVMVGIRETTRSAGQAQPGTVVAQKRGDWFWWVASLAVLGGFGSFIFVPEFRYWVINLIAKTIG